MDNHRHGKANQPLTRSQVLNLVADGKMSVDVGFRYLKEARHSPNTDSASAATTYSAFTPVWQETPLGRGDGAPPATILIFDFDDRFSQMMAQTPGSPTVILVKPGDGYNLIAKHTYQIKPTEYSDFQRLGAELAETTYLPTVILDRWSCMTDGDDFEDNDDNDDNEPESIRVSKRQLAHGIHALFLLAKVFALEPDAFLQAILVFYRPGSALGQALGGATKTIALERPGLICKTIGITEKNDNRLIEIMLGELNPATALDLEVQYRSDQRFVMHYEPAVIDSRKHHDRLRQEGVYLITGGLGGLGLAVAKILAHHYKARLILTGRSAPDAHQEQHLAELRALTSTVNYYQADISKKDDVDQLIAEIKRNNETIAGVIHCAGITKDSLLEKKTVTELTDVIAAKILGTLYLDLALATENLDFFMLFASLSGITGNRGQFDYAFANSFLDGFAARRELQRTQGLRSGNTLAIDWSLWADGNMQIDRSTEQALLHLGIKPLTSDAGLAAFAAWINRDCQQVIIVAGDASKLETTFSQRTWVFRPKKIEFVEKNLVGALEDDLVKIAAGILKVRTDDIGSHDEFGECGFDSISLTDFANAINTTCDLEITPAIFFNNQTIASLAKMLYTEYTHRFNSLYKQLASTEIEHNVTAKANDQSVTTTSFATTATPKVPESNTESPIAIIGMSGMMPQSVDLEHFWEHLKAGDDLVTEIPAARWNWRDYQTDTANNGTDSNSKWGAFIDDVDKFDPLFFNISPSEAELMDPQHRLFLQTVWHTIEDSGYNVSDLAGAAIGVFLGIQFFEYQSLLKEALNEMHGQILTGNSHALAANRVSYLLNFKGPSEAIDTACSSALVAIHRAVQSIRSGESKMAIAGGVCLALSPDTYVGTSQMGVLAADGRCKTFDSRADGYVKGEGVGAILLKPLAAAIADNDHIYGVIRASVVNHGGKAHSLTAPNMDAQSTLLVSAYQQAGFDPATIGYIEVHGTGTKLGDPVEVDGIKRAFTELNAGQPKSLRSKNYCGLGTVKTNIGHLEPAAGIAGVIKVLLCMKHHALAPTINFKEQNPYIDLRDSPFYIVKQFQPWTPLADAAGNTVPRRAGVSSFGFGGTNAHVVLEEYETLPAATAAPVNQQHLFLLSAMDSERLHVAVTNLIAFITKHRTKLHKRLKDIAFTLQTGRQAMPQRLAISALDIDQLESRLTSYLEQDSSHLGIWHGSGGSKNLKTDVLLDGEEGAAFLQSIINNRKLDKLAQLWVSGIDVDWSLCYSEPLPTRIPLPVYPFAKERFWVPEAAKPSNAQAMFDHPLLDAINYHRSIERGLVFSKHLEPSDWIVRDHCVQGRPVFPGVGYLEMAYGAVRMLGMGEASVENVTFLKPLFVDQAQTLDLVIAQDGGKLGFQIQSSSVDSTVLHAKGTINAHAPTTGETPLVVAIAKIQSRCASAIDQTELYAQFQRCGINYGSRFQSVHHVWANAGEEALARIELADAGISGFNQYALHPSIMDGALQTIGALLHNRSAIIPWLPYSVTRVEVYKNLELTGYAYVKNNGTNRFNVAIINDNGEVCCKLHDVCVRPLKQPASIMQTKTEDTLLFASHWRPTPLSFPEHNDPQPIAKPDQRVLIINSSQDFGLGEALDLAHNQDTVVRCELGDTTCQVSANLWTIAVDDALAWTSCIKGQEHFDVIYFLGGMQRCDIAHGDIVAWRLQQEYGVVSLFRLIKCLRQYGLLSVSIKLKIVTNGVHVVQAGDAPLPSAASLFGFTKSLAKEYQGLAISCIDLPSTIGESGMKLATAVAAIKAEPAAMGAEVGYRCDQRYVKEILPLSELARSEQSSFRQHGVYIIAGGTGGIGMALCHHLLQNYAAKVVLLSRNTLDDSRQTNLERLQALAGEVVHMCADITDLTRMRQIADKVRTRFGKINGVVHSAIVLQDQLLENMTEEVLQMVAAPKVQGCIALAAAFATDRLDFLLFFSSAQSFIGNAGQSNYAACSAFEDAFATYIAAHPIDIDHPIPVKVINWGYWGSVGIVATDQYKNQMLAQGMHSIEPDVGMKVIEAVLANRLLQTIVVAANTKTLAAFGIDLNRQIIVSSDVVPALLQTIVPTYINFSSTPAIEEFKMAIAKTLQFANGLLLTVFRKLGIFASAGERYHVAELVSRLRIVPRYSKLFDALLDILARAGFIAIHDDVIITTDILDSGLLHEQLHDIDEQQHKLAGEFAIVEAHINLLATCITAYPDILVGRTDPVQVMFPNGSLSLVENIYKGNDIADYYNRLVSDVVADYVRERLQIDQQAQICILEVGAGTGGTSRFVLERLSAWPANVRYLYTDISMGFVQHGERQFGTLHPFFEAKVFDVEHSPLQQDFQAASCDLILASNVIHATAEMTATLNNLKCLLKANGVLVLNEMIELQDFATLTFGLTSGWWHFTDADKRIKGSPLLSCDQWTGILLAQGFFDVEVASLPTTDIGSPGQGVIIAASDGCAIINREMPTIKKAVIENDRQSLETPSKNAPFQQQITPKPTPTDVVMTAAGDEYNADNETPALLQEYLITIFVEVLKLDRSKFRQNAAFEEFGVDSLMAMTINQRLQQAFGTLPATLLFEHMDIESLSSYFLEHHNAAVKALFPVPKSFVVNDNDDVVFTDGQRPPDEQDQATYQQHTTLAESAATSVTDGLKDNFGEHISNHEKPPQHIPEKKAAWDIAIIGVDGRYPQAQTLAEYWNNLKNGKNCVQEIPRDRWRYEDYFDPDINKKAKSYSKWAGFIDDVDCFDSLFFNISPREAMQIDPQERLFLETVYRTLSNAGYTKENLSAKRQVGVFVGAMNCDYDWLSANANRHTEEIGEPLAFWSIANRVSYYFDFHGPSMAIDTACSSSLTATHIACRSILNGECEVAIAGGVNLILHPMHLVKLTNGHMLAADDRCKAFGVNADGFVDGEGVGAVLLKPLQVAIDDGDHIYAVIKGSSVNSGGKTSGYTVPNPNAQSALIEKTMGDAGIDARTISYVEAHGTGTALGDPIEVAGLTRAFQTATSDRQYCALGSVKSNIGHLESAAGIAAMTKVILQMAAGQIAPSINAETVNPHIDFATSPFYLSQSLSPWNRPILVENGHEVRYPRRAGISSFGAGGANAHMILEEYREHQSKSDVALTESGRYIVPFSARNMERLRVYLDQMINFLANLGASEDVATNLGTIAYTLQVGREVMNERLVIIAWDIMDLTTKLGQFLNTKEAPAKPTPWIYHGNVEHADSELTSLVSGQSGKAFITAAVKHHEYNKLAMLWVAGAHIDWSLLYNSEKPQRIALPAYPFLKKRHWLPQQSVQSVQSELAAGKHPFIDGIDFERSVNHGLCFRKTLTSTNWLVADHRVNGRCMLPGVASFSLVQVAMLNGQGTNRDVQGFADVVWLQPLVVNDETPVFVQLLADQGQWRYEIQTEDSNGTIITHAKGRIVQQAANQEQPSCVAIDNVKQRCPLTFNKETIYQRYLQAGIAYGSSFQCIQTAWSNGIDEVLAVLALPDEGDLQLYPLHPGLLDASLQAMGLLFADVENNAYLPYAVARIRRYRPISKQAHAHVLKIDAHCFNVSLLNDHGECCLLFEKVAVRAQRQSNTSFFYYPRWAVLPSVADCDPWSGDAAEQSQRLIVVIHTTNDFGLAQALTNAHAQDQVTALVLVDANKDQTENSTQIDVNDPNAIQAWFAKQKSPDLIYFLAVTDESFSCDPELLKAMQSRGVLSLFRLIKAIIESPHNHRGLRLKVVTNQIYAVSAEERIQPHMGALPGLLKSFAREYTNIKVSCIDIDIAAEQTDANQAGARPMAMALAVANEPFVKDVIDIAIRGTRRFGREIVPITLPESDQPVFKQNGVYLIAGGAGGIGLALARYLTSSVSARVVLIGRSELDAKQRRQIDEIETGNGEVLYLRADLTNQSQIGAAVAEVKSRYGRIDGAIHSAIVLDDKLLSGMDETSFKMALAPKVEGSVILANALLQEQLDFFLFFSSAQSFVGNAGQSNYAAASTFEDIFAAALKQHAPYPIKVINWGYWGNEGIVAGEEFQQKLQAEGMRSISSADGMLAIQCLLHNPIDQIVAIKAEEWVLTQWVNLEQRISLSPQSPGSGISLETLVTSMGASDASQPIAAKKGFAKLSTLANDLLLAAFWELGVFQENPEQYEINGLYKQLDIAPEYQQLFSSLITILERADFIRTDGSHIITTDAVVSIKTRQRLQALDQQKDDLLADYPEIAAYVKLLWQCLRCYPEILCGKRTAAEIIFPGGSMELVEDIYKNNRIADGYNELLAEALAAYAKDWQGGDTLIRIIEVGAGTGGTTAFILSALTDYRMHVEYTYTDLSKGFLQHGEKFAGENHPPIAFAILDVESDVTAQGFIPGHYDIVIGANVLHATENIRNTLRNMKVLLKTDGWLVLNELTAVLDYSTLTFGLLPGWWRFSDAAERLPGGPIISADNWERLLKEEGFSATARLGLAKYEASGYSQHILITKSDGKVTLNRAVVPTTSKNQYDHRATGKARVQDGEIQAKPESSTVASNDRIRLLILEKVIECVSDVLNLPSIEFNANWDWAEFGVDSIIGTDVINRINNALNIEMGTAVLFDSDNITGLVDYIQSEYRSEIGESFALSDNGCSELVKIQPKGSKRISFWVPGGHGLAQVYNQLAVTLGTDYPVYGFQGRGVDGIQQPFTSIEQMASHYVNCLQNIQPNGPYILGGYSFGGIIAVEMAQQLARQHQQVDRIVMLDTFPADDYVTSLVSDKMTPSFKMTLVANVFLYGAAAQAIIKVEDFTNVAQQDYCSHAVRLILEKKKSGLTASDLHRQLQGILNYTDYTSAILKTYHSVPYSGNVLYFKTTHGFVAADNPLLPRLDVFGDYDYLAPWYELINGSLTVVEVDCDHFSLLQNPFIDIVTKHLRPILEN